RQRRRLKMIVKHFRGVRWALSTMGAMVALMGFGAGHAFGQEAAAQAHRPGGEANLVLPDLSQVTFLGAIDGHTLLYSGLVVSALGLLFGLTIYNQLKNMLV